MSLETGEADAPHRHTTTYRGGNESSSCLSNQGMAGGGLGLSSWRGSHAVGGGEAQDSPHLAVHLRKRWTPPFYRLTIPTGLGRGGASSVCFTLI